MVTLRGQLLHSSSALTLVFYKVGVHKMKLPRFS